MVFLIGIKEKKMKKNFMAIASLLIAAMLLVVSCSQEVAPKDDAHSGLVEARLIANYGRTIKVDDATDAESLTLQYKMTHNWNNPENNPLYEGITNPALSWTELHDDGKLGWVTPGNWTIHVRAVKLTDGMSDEAKKSEDLKSVFSGSVTKYFAKDNTTATVYLNPNSANTTNSVTIDVTMQDIKDANGNSYILKYALVAGNTAITTTTVNDAVTFGTVGSTAEGSNITKYSQSVTKLADGFYTLIIYVMNGTNGNEVVGGVREGFLLTNGAQAKVTGHVEPSDYESVSINTEYVNVNATLSTPSIIYQKEQAKAGVENQTEWVTTSANDAGQAVVTITCTDTTSAYSSIAKLDGYTPTFCWMVDGQVVAQENGSIKSGTSSSTSRPTSTLTYTFDNPGNKNITCQVIYSKTVSGEGSVFFSETKSTQVKVDQTRFAL